MKSFHVVLACAVLMGHAGYYHCLQKPAAMLGPCIGFTILIAACAYGRRPEAHLEAPRCRIWSTWVLASAASAGTMPFGPQVVCATLAFSIFAGCIVPEQALLFPKVRKRPAGHEHAWRSRFHDLQVWLETHQGQYPSQMASSSRERKLGRWVANQAARMKHMRKSRVKALETLPGWLARIKPWEATYNELQAWLKEQATEWASQQYPSRFSHDSAEARLGEWVHLQQKSYRACGRPPLSQERKHKLEALPDWSWPLMNKPTWEFMFATLLKWSGSNRSGHPRYDFEFVTPEHGWVPLGNWLRFQMRALRKGRRRLRGKQHLWLPSGLGGRSITARERASLKFESWMTSERARLLREWMSKQMTDAILILAAALQDEQEDEVKASMHQQEAEDQAGEKDERHEEGVEVANEKDGQDEPIGLGTSGDAHVKNLSELQSPHSRSSAPALLKPGDWLCPACGDHQFAKNVACRMCGARNPHPTNYKKERKAGDWCCPDCRMTNFAKAEECRRCGWVWPAIARARALNVVPSWSNDGGWSCSR